MEEIKKEAERILFRFLMETHLTGETTHVKNVAKQCALICIDEIQKAIDWHEYEYPNETFYYWDKVKKYIKDNY